ncbi:MAG: hypothetical protein V1867_05115 [Candidatus Falkowbacteria bacterium]
MPKALKKSIKIFFLLLLTGALIYKFFFYYDPGNKCLIRLKPSLTEWSNGNIKEGIKVLKHAVPDEYKKLCAYVDKINPNYSCGGLGGGCYISGKAPTREIDISTVYDGFLGWTAAVIAHETCHAVQHEEGRPFNETECYGIGDYVLNSTVVY